MGPRKLERKLGFTSEHPSPILPEREECQSFVRVVSGMEPRFCRLQDLRVRPMWFCSWVLPKRPHTNGNSKPPYNSRSFPFSSHVGLSSSLIPLTISTSNKGSY